MNWIAGSFALAGFLTFFVNLIISLVIYFKNPTSKVNRLFSLFFLSVSIYGVGFFRQALSASPSQEMLSIKILLFGTIFIPIFFVHATYTILNKKIYKPVLFGIYSLGLVFQVINIFTDFLARDPIPKFGLKYLFQAGPLYPALMAGFVVATAVSIYKLHKSYKTSSGLERNRLKYLFYGMIVGFIGGTPGFMLGYNIDLFPFNPFSSYGVFLANILIGYAIVRYRLMDIKIAFTRFSIFTVVYAIVLGIPFAVGWWGKELLLQKVGENWWFLPVILSTVLASLGPSVYLYLQHKTEDRMFREQRQRQEIILKASKSITLIKDLNKVLKYIGMLVTKILKVDYSAIFLLDKQNLNYHLSSSRGNIPILKYTIITKDSPLIKYILGHKGPLVYEEIKLKSDMLNSKEKETEALMQNISAQVIIPSFLKESLIGFVILGNKTSSEIYTEDDLLTLSIMANYSALAIEYAQFLKELEELHAKLREAEKLKGIAQMMHSLNHELRNIFNKMSMPLQMIELGEFDNDKGAFNNVLKTISENIDLGVEILEYVQSYRNKSKSTEVRPKKLENVIDKSLSYFSKRFQEANIRITKTMQPNLPDVETRNTFNDLFVNILANCYFALIDKLEGERLIEIQSHLSEDKNTIQVKISDTGSDMTKSSYQADKDSPFKERGKIGGVNFGLAYLITNQHNGSLEVESYEKGGTAFVINIPIRQ